MTEKHPLTEFRTQSVVSLRWALRRSWETLQGHGGRTLAQLAAKNIRYSINMWRDASIDRHLGIKTGGLVKREHLDTDSPNKKFATIYKATAAKPFMAMLSYLPNNPEDFTFVDFGSGRGRTLLLASELPFKRVVGVEFSTTLHAEANNNIDSYCGRHKLGNRPESILADATTFPIPEGPLVIYMFDPFNATVTKGVFDNIVASYRACPRIMYFIYYGPVHKQIVLDTGIFSELPTAPLPPDPTLGRPLAFSLFATPEHNN
ncbi:class I SAM-dependent methyltransferase [Thioalkalivibrio sp. AKL6]|uniref:class I SAM-dependent methyltransferase n=1 Tax=Thioalkalivibrio sp. AKL6 TaxID=1158154 RepID=UPI001E658BCC|nr:class I SAM-dependent methyltransferase [Thioalkalivibrio sp. AKL6]